MSLTLLSAARVSVCLAAKGDWWNLSEHQAITVLCRNPQGALMTGKILTEVKPNLFTQHLGTELNTVPLPALLQLSEELRPPLLHFT